MKINLLPPHAVKLYAFFAALLLAAVAHAAGDPPLPRFVRLDYARPPGPPGRRCPPLEELRDLLVSETNRDPFNDVAPALLRVLIARRGLDYEATIQLLDPSGANVWPDPPLKPARSCDSLAQDVAFAVGLVLRDRPAPPPSSPPPPTPSLHEAPRAEAPRAEAPRAEAPLVDKLPPEALRLNLGIAGALTLRNARPLPGFNLAADLGLRWRFLSGTLEFRWTPPIVVVVDTSGHELVRLTQYSGGFVPCGHFRVFFACGVGQVVALAAHSAPGVEPRSLTMATFAAGARIGGDVPLPGWARRFAVRGSADVLVNTRDVALQYGNVMPAPTAPNPAWTTARVTVVFGLGFTSDLRLKRPF